MARLKNKQQKWAEELKSVEIEEKLNPEKVQRKDYTEQFNPDDDYDITEPDYDDFYENSDLESDEVFNAIDLPVDFRLKQVLIEITNDSPVSDDTMESILLEELQENLGNKGIYLRDENDKEVLDEVLVDSLTSSCCSLDFSINGETIEPGSEKVEEYNNLSESIVGRNEKLFDKVSSYYENRGEPLDLYTICDRQAQQELDDEFKARVQKEENVNPYEDDYDIEEEDELEF